MLLRLLSAAALGSQEASLSLGGCRIYSTCPIEHEGGVTAAAPPPPVPIPTRELIESVNASLTNELAATHRLLTATQEQVATLSSELTTARSELESLRAAASPIACTNGRFPPSSITTDTSGQTGWTQPENVWNPNGNWHTDSGGSSTYVIADLGAANHLYFMATHFYQSIPTGGGLTAGQHYQIHASYDASSWVTVWDENRDPGNRCAAHYCAFHMPGTYRYYRVWKSSGSSGAWQGGVSLYGLCGGR